MTLNDQSNKIIVGLTGGIGSGKTLACSFFSSCGAYVINSDLVYKRIAFRSKKMKKEIFDFFGGEVFDNDGNIISQKLSRQVFSDPDKLHALNRITHKYVLKHIEKTIQLCNNRVVVIETAILFECGLHKSCDFTIIILADDQLRIERVGRRQEISAEDIKKCMSNQKFYEFLHQADFIITNDGSISQLKSKICEVYKCISSAAHL